MTVTQTHLFFINTKSRDIGTLKIHDAVQTVCFVNVQMNLGEGSSSGAMVSKIEENFTIQSRCVQEMIWTNSRRVWAEANL